MKSIFIILSFAFSISACSSIPLNVEQRKEAEVAIEDDNYQRLEQLIGSKEDGSFIYSCLLDTATRNIAADSKCRPEIMSLLLKKGATFTERHKSESPPKQGRFSHEFIPGCERMFEFTYLLQSTCSDLAEKALSSITPEEAGKATADALKDHLDKGYAPESKSLVKFSGKVINILAVACAKNGKRSQYCSLAQTIKDRGHELSERDSTHEEFTQQEKRNNEKTASDNLLRDKEAAYRHTPEGQACESLHNIRIADQMIAHETEVGKASGYVNKATLHEAGQMKVYAQQALVKAKAEYKKVSGKDFSPSSCHSD